MTDKFIMLVDKFVTWGKTSDKLSAALIIGSQAREDHQADEYSDLDIIIVTDDPAYFLSSDQWLDNIGNFHVSFIEDTIAGEKERRILFDDALDVDFVILTPKTIDKLGRESLGILERGYSILIDKMGVLGDICQPAVGVDRSFAFPKEQDYLNIVNDFWFHAVWTTKKIKRGELWTAEFCMDSYMKWKLLSIIECHAHAIHGLEYDTWHSGRFIEEWAEPWIIDELSPCFAHYNKEDITAALFSTMKLFRRVAVEVSNKLDFHYPKAADEFAFAWVSNAFS